MKLDGVLVLAGPPCSGKSVVARALAEQSGMPYVQVDSVFDLLFPHSDRNASDRMLAYDGAHLLARLLLAHGLSPLLECTYSRRAQRESLVQTLIQTPPISLYVVEFAVDPDEAVRRFQGSATHQATDLTGELVFERARSFPYSDDALRVQSGTAGTDDLARLIVDWLVSDPMPLAAEAWVQAGKPASAR